MTRAIAGFHAQTDIVVIGHNAEMADYDNPRGELYGFAGYVIAESPEGDRWAWHVATQRHDERALLQQCERLAAALTARLARGLHPVGFAGWPETRPCYGSPAYVAYGAADDLELERMEG